MKRQCKTHRAYFDPSQAPHYVSFSDNEFICDFARLFRLFCPTLNDLRTCLFENLQLLEFTSFRTFSPMTVYSVLLSCLLPWLSQFRNPQSRPAFQYNLIYFSLAYVFCSGFLGFRYLYVIIAFIWINVIMRITSSYKTFQ